MNSHEYSDTSPSYFQNLKTGFTIKKKLACIALSCVPLLSVVVLFVNAQAPEESKIAFGSGRCHPGNPLVRSEIYGMDEDGNNQLNITDNPANDRNPSWSPDGQSIAFGNCLVQPKRVAILVWQCIAPDYRQRGIPGLYVGGASCPDIPRSR